MNQYQIDEILTEETKKLVGYIMPILEALSPDAQNKQNVKKILWNHKENLKEKLTQDQEKHDQQFNK